jgi:hypothetical protein
MSYIYSITYIKNGSDNNIYISICPHCYHFNNFDNNINIKNAYCYGCSCSIKIIKSTDKIDFLYEEMQEDYDNNKLTK